MLYRKKIVKPYKNVVYHFKSAYHANLYPNITNFKIIGNGINKGDFREKTTA